MSSGDCPFCQRLAQLESQPDEDLLWLFPHSVALLGPWQYYKGHCILVARRHATELNQLSPNVRHAYFEEMCCLARAIEDAFHPLKLNYELLGNQVPHLHWHLFPRYAEDPGRLQPVWLALNDADKDPKEKRRLQQGAVERPAILQSLRDRISNLTSFHS
jgi:diadenosine tetraphosphate (Ap4A) HIT family hydrolase